MTRKSLLILSFILLYRLAAHAESVKDTLSHQYKKHVIVLRAPFTSKVEKFDSNGQSLNPAPHGTWLVYGGFFVEKIGLSPQALRFEGHRVGFIQGKDKKQNPISLGKSVRVEILLDQPLKTADELQPLLGRIFIVNGTVDQAKPQYRRADDNIPREEIYRYSKDKVSLPKSIYTPDPEFSEDARKRRFQGEVVLNVVIDQAGKVSRIRLERALGYGLDENAMEAVESWRFEPATLDGKPVAVEMAIEVGFHLY